LQLYETVVLNKGAAKRFLDPRKPSECNMNAVMLFHCSPFSGKALYMIYNRCWQPFRTTRPLQWVKTAH